VISFVECGGVGDEWVALVLSIPVIQGSHLGLNTDNRD
jgi:hypothetical protein